jgi:hypothetical protein
MNESGVSLFLDTVEYCYLTEDIWEHLVRRLKRIEDSELRKHRFSTMINKRIESHIISSIPSLFDDFGKKRYELLYCGSRDGFDSVNMHKRIDGHSHTLLVIETTKGDIFGSYNHCCWDSSNSWKVDESHQSFIFTLKNPHDFPPHKFPLKSSMKHYTMICHLNDPMVYIGNGGAIRIYDNCNVNNKSCMNYWDKENASYANDTGLDGHTLFTGEKNFTVKELEIFELTDRPMH